MKNKPIDEINNLLDFYEVLLTEKQQKVMDYYYREDYSLSEISELLNISRAAILDNIKRSEKILKDYESKLKLVEKFMIRNSIYEEMLRDGNIKYVEKLKESE